ELAEVAGLLSQLEDFIDDLVDAAEGHAIVYHIIVSDLFVWLLFVAFEYVEPVTAFHLSAHLLEIESVRALDVVMAVALRHSVVISEEVRARAPPICNVCLGSGFSLSLHIVGPVRLEVF